MKTNLLLGILTLCSSTVFSQNPIPQVTAGNKLKIGLYKEWNEFINNTPFITSAFVVIPKYQTNAKENNETDTSSANEATDTLNDYGYRLSDTTIRQKRIFGFFDGNRMYVAKYLFSESLLEYLKKPRYVAVDHIGRYAFVTVDMKRLYLSGLGVVDALISNPKSEIWYFDKKGTFRQATGQAIFFLLKKDKDFLKEFNAERNVTNEVLKKYLIKMNERYPL